MDNCFYWSGGFVETEFELQTPVQLPENEYMILMAEAQAYFLLRYLLHDKNITGISIADKRIGSAGDILKGHFLVFQVKQKQLKPAVPIPPQLYYKGVCIPTDIVEAGFASFQFAFSPGDSLSRKNETEWGSCGMKVAGTGAFNQGVFVLTNYHVAAFAAPPHSYRTVRKSQRSVTLAAYPGVYVGGEKSFSDHQSGAASFGVTAPVGFSFNWGRYKASKAGDEAMASHSLFVSLVDIGAALSFRWQNDSIDLPRKITLSQIFFPGLFYVHGWKNSPIARKFGFQYAPALRQIKDGQQAVTDNVVVWRISLGLSVDIPVFLLSRK
ncbi:hypothetical protein [Filimonas effusa]|uniref:Uncharacterized protein n=1 Tax=Filimonas effusa TaxID=2508721 RepID=A0A4Q1D7K1_9BACT|nr:hypothetical protein [Filimonas effusa]RXK83731.1 hypothetical protein ESB13_16775 [Filimonas effusa]